MTQQKKGNSGQYLALDLALIYLARCSTRSTVLRACSSMLPTELKMKREDTSRPMRNIFVSQVVDSQTAPKPSVSSSRVTCPSFSGKRLLPQSQSPFVQAFIVGLTSNPPFPSRPSSTRFTKKDLPVRYFPAMERTQTFCWGGRDSRKREASRLTSTAPSLLQQTKGRALLLYIIQIQPRNQMLSRSMIQQKRASLLRTLRKKEIAPLLADARSHELPQQPHPLRASLPPQLGSRYDALLKQPLASLDSLIPLLKSTSTQLEGLVGIRKIATLAETDPESLLNTPCLAAGVIQAASQPGLPALQLYECLWIISVLTDGRQFTVFKKLVEPGCLGPLLEQALSHPSDYVLEMAVYVYSNLSTFRHIQQQFFSEGLLCRLLQLCCLKFDQFREAQLRENIAWSISNFSATRLSLGRELCAKAITVLLQALDLTKEQSFALDYLKGVLNLHQKAWDKGQYILSLAQVKQLVSLVEDCPEDTLLQQLLRVLAAVSSKGLNLSCSEELAKLDFARLYARKAKAVKQYALLVLANLVADPWQPQLGARLAEGGWVQRLKASLPAEHSKVKREWIQLLVNLLNSRDKVKIFEKCAELKLHLLLLQQLRGHEAQPKYLVDVLGALYLLFQNDNEQRLGLIRELLEAGGREVFDALQSHQQENVYNAVLQLLQTNFTEL